MPRKSKSQSTVDKEIVVEKSEDFNISKNTQELEEEKDSQSVSYNYNDSTDTSSSSDESTCAICLEEMVHPVQTPCKHNFCFLCLKGVSLTNGYTCPMCRQAISQDFFKKPTLLTPPSVKKIRLQKKSMRNKSQLEDSNKELFHYQWYYKGMKGWWRYDARTNKEIEEAYIQGKETITLLIAGHNFKIDLKSMYQQKADGHGLMRDIKRDTPSCAAKGTAGLYSSTLASAGNASQFDDSSSTPKRRKKN